MAIREISMHLPETLLENLDETIEEGSLTRDEVLTRLVEDYLRKRGAERKIATATLDRLGEDLGFYGSLSYRYLNEELDRTASIDDIELDSDEIVEAIYRAFGTKDPVELIERVRYREL